MLALFLCLVMGVSGQEEFTEPEAKLLSVVPFTRMSGGVVILTGIVNNYTDSLNFILDTGSGGISLDSLTCVRLNISLTPSERTIRGIGGIRKVNFLNNATLKLKGLQVDSLNFHVNDYDILSSVYGIKIDGIIGYSFLSRYIVKLDYDSSVMYVYSKGEFRYPRGGHILRPQFGTIPIQQVKFRDEPKRPFTNKFYFDTGAGLCFLLSKDYATDSAVMRKKKPAPVITQAEGLGGKMQMELTTVKEIQLGPYKFRNVPTFVFEDKFNVTSYPFLGGLIGNDILRRFTVTLNYGKKEIHILPNSHYHEGFDYSYTGLGVYFVNDKVVVEDVVTGSPGDKAGFQPGDVIIGINNNYSNNIQAYKNLMQTTGTKLRILVLREGQPFELYMKPRSILKG
ncbi:MAG TPA: aspartyl protease family protein [Chitinophagaceae bacterium]|nr:aspartyl protease family protein [Chitinophagaceae bacterium]